MKTKKPIFENALVDVESLICEKVQDSLVLGTGDVLSMTELINLHKLISDQRPTADHYLQVTNWQIEYLETEYDEGTPQYQAIAGFLLDFQKTMSQELLSRSDTAKDGLLLQESLPS